MNKKNILYITTRLPWPLIGGDRLHIYHYLKELKQRGYNITIVTLVRDDDDLDGVITHNEFYAKLLPVKYNTKLAYLYAVKALFNDKPFIVEYYYNKKMQKIIENEIKTGQYDIVIGYITRSFPYLKKIKNIKKIIHLCDAISMMYERRIKEKSNLLDKIKIGIEYLKVKNYEKLSCKYTDAQILVSKIDKNYLSKFTNTDKCEIIGLATDTEYYRPIDCSKKNTICFVGSMQYIPNSEAVLYFGKEILPIIKKEIPDIKFKIIGANPRKELFETFNNIDEIEITGKVDDVREYMKECKVSICPVKISGGIQNKILEAMSMEIPVVTTPECAEGIGANENVLLIARNNKEYAQKVIDLIKNEKFNHEISKKSREFILENFSWKKVGDEWEKIIIKTLNV